MAGLVKALIIFTVIVNYVIPECINRGYGSNTRFPIKALGNDRLLCYVDRETLLFVRFNESYTCDVSSSLLLSRNNR
jgi:hypothetical protein